jgi:hypothetical protein
MNTPTSPSKGAGVTNEGIISASNPFLANILHILGHSTFSIRYIF